MSYSCQTRAKVLPPTCDCDTRSLTPLRRTVFLRSGARSPQYASRVLDAGLASVVLVEQLCEERQSRSDGGLLASDLSVRGEAIRCAPPSPSRRSVAEPGKLEFRTA